MNVTTTVIRVTSRMSKKFGEEYYTLEYSEERTIQTEGTEVDISEDALAEERKKLWDTCNSEVDNQMEDIAKLYKKSKNR